MPCRYCSTGGRAAAHAAFYEATLGAVQVNTYEPTKRLMFDAESIAYHEGVPGHHFQISIQRELTRLPMFRRHARFVAFSEGWALYSERLGKDVGLYTHDHSTTDEPSVQAETDRYIANPGQALAYKIGQLTISRLRERAKDALGARFDIRAFHDEVLGAGALPLEILEQRIDEWIARTKA